MHTTRTQHTSHLVELVHDLENKLKQIENAPSTQAVSQLEQLAITTMQAIQVEANLVGYDLQDTVQAARKTLNDRQTEATMQYIANHRPTYDPLDRNANRRYKLSYSRQDGFNAHKVHDLYTGAPAPEPAPTPEPTPQPEQNPNTPEQTPNKPARKAPAKKAPAKKSPGRPRKTTKK